MNARQIKLDWEPHSTPQGLLLAVSGGIDSMVMLDAVVRRNRGRVPLHIAHVNYGLRDAAQADAEFVRGHAGRYDVPCHVHIVDVVPEEGNRQAWAREVRYMWFAELIAMHELDAVAVAHHADDAAETMLWHLCRGGGAEALRGLAEQSAIAGAPVVRPLLGADRAQVRAYAEERALTWREDLSNASPEYTRNRIRHEVLPRCESIHAGAARHMVRVAHELRDDFAALDALAQQSALQLGCWQGREAVSWERAALGHLPDALARRVVQHFFSQLAPALGRLHAVHLHAIMQLNGGEGLAFCLPGPHVALRDGENLVLRAGALS